MAGHSFTFSQEGPVALGVKKLELDGKPLICRSFTLTASVGDITELDIHGVVLESVNLKLTEPSENVE